MTKIANVLIATDFSDSSRIAFDRAVEVAKTQGAKLIVAHSLSVERYSYGGPDFVALPVDIEQNVRRAALDTLETWVAEAKVAGLDAEPALLEGGAALTVPAAAESIPADLVVVGTRGNTGFAHLLLGSTAEAIVRHAPCPVLTVHPGDESSLSDVSVVVIPTDFSDDAGRSVECVAELLEAHEGPIRIILVHAYHLPVMLMPLAHSYPVAAVSAGDTRERITEELVPIAESLRAKGYPVEIEVREGDSATVITELADQAGADLIALGTRGFAKVKQLLVGSTAERVVQHATCPVLTVRHS